MEVFMEQLRGTVHIHIFFAYKMRRWQDLVACLHECSDDGGALVLDRAAQRLTQQR